MSQRTELVEKITGSSPAYTKDWFINREAEIELVMAKFQALLQGQPARERTITFTGEHGAGKSWLLAHLHQQFAASEKAAAFFLDLADYTAANSPITVVVQIMQRLSDEVLGRRFPGETDPAEISNFLVREVQPILKQKILALLIDSVYESSWELLPYLENYLLGPLVVEPEVMIVLGGRGRAYAWTAPELRIDARFITLLPFETVEMTIQQLERQKPEAAIHGTKIHQLSGGNPKANYLLAVYHDPAFALDQTIEGMLMPVPPKQRRLIRDYLEALAVLRFFDESRIPALLGAYNPQVYPELSRQQARQILDQLVKPGFAFWDSTEFGYILMESTRNLILRYLFMAQRARWLTLQQAALNLYRHWVEVYPRNRERWQREVEYHRSQLEAAEQAGSSS
jgi:hypothetical protein